MLRLGPQPVLELRQTVELLGDPFLGAVLVPTGRVAKVTLAEPDMGARLDAERFTEVRHPRIVARRRRSGGTTAAIERGTIGGHPSPIPCAEERSHDRCHRN